MKSPKLHFSLACLVTDLRDAKATLAYYSSRVDRSQMQSALDRRNAQLQAIVDRAQYDYDDARKGTSRKNKIAMDEALAA